MSKGPISRFVLDAFNEGVFAPVQTPEELLAILMARKYATEDVGIFVQHARKTAFADLTVVEVLAGQRKTGRDTDEAQQRLLDRSVEERVAVVVREATWWDLQAQKAAAGEC